MTLVINIDKKFFIRLLLVVGMVYGGFKYGAKVGYKQALTDVMEYLNQKEGKSDELSVPERSEAPLKPQSFHHPELDGEPGNYPYTEL